MSHVTNLVLSIGVDDRCYGKINQVNQFFREIEKGLISCDDPSLPRKWYGGTKMLETNLYIGAFNHLDIPALLGHLRSIAWESPSEVQLLIKDQNDERFRLINVMENSS